MMKKPFTLKRYITIYLGGLTLVLVIIYSILLNRYLVMGLDEASGRDMRLAAEAFSRSLQSDLDPPLPQGPRTTAFIGPGSLPGWVTRELRPPYRHAKLLVGHGRRKPKESGPGMYLLFPYNLPDGRQLFLLKTYTREDLTGGLNIDMFEITAWLLGLGSILFVVLAVRYLMHRLSSPVEKLGKWAGTLTADNIGQPHPDFRFDEINQLADLLQNAVTQLHRTLEREHRFLRNASHELRTPIAVAMSNLELWELVRPAPDKEEQAVYQRIHRAVDNMHKLTQTLLWLGRADEAAPSREPVRLDALATELAADNQYLLKGKSAAVSLDTEPVELMTSETACRIVLNNLMRNAFQYTGRGEISIRVRPGSVAIKNIAQNRAGPGPKGEDYGFGLGLGIVEQVTEKMGWAYQITEIHSGREVRITFETQA